MIIFFFSGRTWNYLLYILYSETLSKMYLDIFQNIGSVQFIVLDNSIPFLTVRICILRKIILRQHFTWVFLFSIKMNICFNDNRSLCFFVRIHSWKWRSLLLVFVHIFPVHCEIGLVINNNLRVFNFFYFPFPQQYHERLPRA